MHWVKLVVESWLLLGFFTVVWGLLWTNRAARTASVAAAPPKNSAPQPSNRRREFGAASLSNAS